MRSVNINNIFGVLDMSGFRSRKKTDDCSEKTSSSKKLLIGNFGGGLKVVMKKVEFECGDMSKLSPFFHCFRNQVSERRKNC